MLEELDDDIDDGIVVPRTRRRAPFLAAAAAVVTALLASSTVALVGGGAWQPAAGPASAVSLPAEPDLRRCAAAVVSAGRAADFPPFDTWRVTAMLLQSPGAEDHAIAVNDTFACVLGMTDVRLSDPDGHAFGPVTVARLAPAMPS